MNPILFSLLALGAFDPYNLSRHHEQSSLILEYAETPEEAFELHAIAFTESRFNPEAKSNTGDYGMFQVNCNVWWRHFRFANKSACKIAMMNPRVSIVFAKKILEKYKTLYPQCRNSFAYLCYNGGTGWRVSNNKEKILYYRRAILKRMRIFERRYGKYFEKVVKGHYDVELALCKEKALEPISEVYASM
jgi:hypothetical protein